MITQNTSVINDCPPKRTFLLNLLIIGFLLLAWFGGVRCYAVFADRDLLNLYISSTGLAYIAISGAIWALAGLASAISLWFGLSFSTCLSRLTALAYFLWYWFDYLFLSQSTLSKINWPFTLVASLLGLVFAWGVPALPKESRYPQRRG